jgi:hypothetical protein
MMLLRLDLNPPALCHSRGNGNPLTIKSRDSFLQKNETRILIVIPEASK